jgi:hypothetical protein
MTCRYSLVLCCIPYLLTWWPLILDLVEAAPDTATYTFLKARILVTH